MTIPWVVSHLPVVLRAAVLGGVRPEPRGRGGRLHVCCSLTGRRSRLSCRAALRTIKCGDGVSDATRHAYLPEHTSATSIVH